MDSERDSNLRPAPISYASPDLSKRGRTAVAATFANQFEANLARNLLEQNGIECFTTGEALNSGLGAYVGAMQKMDIVVADADADEARRLIESVREARAARLQGPAAPPCPNCGATGARRRFGRGALAVIIVCVGGFFTLVLQDPRWVGCALLPAIYLLLTWDRARWMCVECGKKFTAKAVEPSRSDEDEE